MHAMEQQHSGSRNFRFNMRQYQDRRAAQVKMQQGKIFFKKTLIAWSLPPHSKLVLPALFVHQHHDKFHKSVTLKNIEKDKMWPVEMKVFFPLKQRQVLLSSGWKAFAIANDLAVGDRLTFVLVAQSLFHVSILRGRGNSSLSVERPKICSQEPTSVRRETNNLETTLRPGTQLSCAIPTNGCEGSKLTRTGTLFTKETAKETRGAEVAPEAPGSSQGPSGMDSRCFEQMVASMTQLDMMKTDGAGVHIGFNE